VCHWHIPMKLLVVAAATPWVMDVCHKTELNHDLALENYSIHCETQINSLINFGKSIHLWKIGAWFQLCLGWSATNSLTQSLHCIAWSNQQLLLIIYWLCWFVLLWNIIDVFVLSVCRQIKSFITDTKSNTCTVIKQWQGWNSTESKLHSADLTSFWIKHSIYNKLKLLKTTYTRICRIAPYFPNMSYISSAVILYGRFFTYRILFTSGGRRTCIDNNFTN